LYENTTGANNTATGFQALYTNSTGTHNVGNGHNALFNLTTGDENTAIGKSALENNNTGGKNTSIGCFAGDKITTGGYNVLLGHNAGSYGVNLTTGGDNVILGSHSRTTASDSVRAVVIGYNVAGASDYTTLGNSGNDIRAAHGNASWATVSDRRVKKDIQDATAGLNFVKELRPRTFKFKTKGDLPEEFNGYEEGSTEAFKNSKTNHGFIAQEVKEVIDNHSEIADGFSLWDVRESGQQEVAEAALIPILVKAIQEQQILIESLTTRIESLGG